MVTETTTPLRPLWLEALALYVITLLATVPYASLIAKEDGLPGDIERIIANAVAAAIGFWIIGCVVGWFNRKKARRFLIACITVIVLAGFAFLAAYRRSQGIGSQ